MAVATSFEAVWLIGARAKIFRDVSKKKDDKVLESNN